jgi:hypothetical protein
LMFRYNFMPLEIHDSVLTIAIADPHCSYTSIGGLKPGVTGDFRKRAVSRYQERT